MEKEKEEPIIVITSGFFNPAHKGHVEYLHLAKNLFPNTHHVVIVNNDKQVLIKKGYTFIPIDDRAAVIHHLRSVDEVFHCIDEDISVCQSIKTIAEKYKGRKIVFAKGGDRNSGNIPEKVVCDEYGIEIVDGVGAKVQSSSNLIQSLNEGMKKKE